MPKSTPNDYTLKFAKGDPPSKCLRIPITNQLVCTLGIAIIKIISIP